MNSIVSQNICTHVDVLDKKTSCFVDLNVLK